MQQTCRSTVAKFTPLVNYITKYNTRYTDRECWAWTPCGKQNYVVQLPVDDGMGYLVQPLVCSPLSSRVISRDQYKLVDGSATLDRDNVWVDCTGCGPGTYKVCGFWFCLQGYGGRVPDNAFWIAVPALYGDQEFSML